MTKWLAGLVSVSIGCAVMFMFPANAPAAEKKIETYTEEKNTSTPSVVQRVLGSAYQTYQAVKENPPTAQQSQPASHPRQGDLEGNRTTNPAQHPNPWRHKLEIGQMPTMDEARGWITNPGAQDHRNSQSPASAIPARGSTPFVTTGRQEQSTPANADQTLSRYKVQPGGVVLEGTATGFGSIDRVRYDGVLNAVVLDDSALYFLPIPPDSAAVLCRAIAQDERVGVSLGRVQIVFGGVPADSQVAIDLKLTDKFFGDIVFARREWIGKDKLVNGYQPQPHQGQSFNVAAFFIFNGFGFVVDRNELRATQGNFVTRVVPLLSEKSAEGGHLPDRNAILHGVRSPQYEANAKHIADYVDHYRREESVDRTFHYGAFAAFLRAIKTQGFDLRVLAQVIESSSGKGPRPAGPNIADMQRPIDDLFAAWERLDLQSYLAQWSPAAVQFIGPKPRRFAELRQAREAIFGQLVSVNVAYTPLYRGFQKGLGYFDSTYEMILHYQNGRVLRDTACESYKVRKEGSRWVIIENQDYKEC